jgi:hypothetical protein
MNRSVRLSVGPGLLIAVLLAVSLFACIGDSKAFADPSGSSSTSFCSGAPVRDFERPFDHMQSDHPIPKSGELPFGPNIGIYALTRPLVVGKGIFGFGFSSETRGHRSRSLGWTLRLVLDRINPQGRVVQTEEVLTRKARSTADLIRMRLELKLEGSPALYRTTLSFEDREGEALGTYTQYVRVVPPVASGSLKLDKNVVYPGGEIAFRVDNSGTVAIGTGSGYRLERLDGEQWQVVVEGSTSRGRRRLRVLFAGESSSCEHLAITSSLGPGQYRLSKEVQWRSEQHRRLSARFRIVAA